jgi:hypothetical protein
LASAAIAGLCFHDLRHRAITKLAESEASDQTIRSIAGHLDRKMPEHYSYIRNAAKRKTVETISSYDPSDPHDLNAPRECSDFKPSQRLWAFRKRSYSKLLLPQKLRKPFMVTSSPSGLVSTKPPAKVAVSGTHGNLQSESVSNNREVLKWKARNAF